MRVRILKDIFETDVFLDDLDNLFKYFRTGKHSLVLSDIDAIEALKATDWYEENPRNQKIIDKFIKASAKKNSGRKSITISSQNTDINFKPGEAVRYLDQPLTILLENSVNDSPFINAVIKHFDSDGTLKIAKDEQWFKYGMGGGSSIAAVVKSDLRESFNHQSFTKDKKVYLRYFVILDSDKSWPGMTVPDYKVETFRENDVLHHVLHKREMENYVPVEAIRKLGDNYLNLYIRFPKDEQKDFFDIQKGFAGKARNRMQPVEVLALYPESEVPFGNWEVLKQGITMEKYKGNLFKTEFSKLFDDNTVTTATMQAMIRHQPKHEGGLNEYEFIIDNIKKLL